MYMTNLAAEAAPRRESEADLLALLYAGTPLDQAEAELLFGALVRGALDDPAIAAMLVALKVRGETTDELIGAARALRAADMPFDRPDYLFADSCGTGGDGSGTINLSTAVAFVAAAAGLPVAKHGNRSVTSRCGSADVLEQLGVKLDCAPDVSRRALDETGPLLPVRAALPSGPAPCRAGAARARHPHDHEHARPLRESGRAARAIARRRRPERLLEPVARDPRRAGRRAGDGRARLRPRRGRACTARPRRCGCRDGALEELTITPEPMSASRRRRWPRSRGGDPEENAARLKALLQGYGTRTEKQAVALNAGALLFTAGKAAEPRAKAPRSRSTRWPRARAIARLEAFVEAISNG